MNKPLKQPETEIKNGCCCASRRSSSAMTLEVNKGVEVSTQLFKVEGANCATCVGKIEQALLTISGIKQAHMDLSMGTATVTDAIDRIDKTDLIRTLAQAGFVATPINSTSSKNNAELYDE